ncbi:thiol:disulfide interchange protein DsbA/DsbL [Halorhodospira neutriphila]|nr:thiol:disulfide interchange protein DsbA/DsbL [Halorhodospira neutriphila]
MRRMSGVLLAAAAALLMAGGGSAAELKAGEDYRKVGEPRVNDDGTVPVADFFSYLCPHCARFSERFSAWLERAQPPVAVEEIPVVFRPSWEPLARAYWVAETLGAVEQVHGPLFRAIHEQRRNLGSREALRAFFVEHGVEGEAFDQAWDGIGVDRGLRRARQAMADYGIRVTPSVVVAEAYLVTPRQAGSLEAMIETIAALVERHAEEGG